MVRLLELLEQPKAAFLDGEDATVFQPTAILLYQLKRIRNDEFCCKEV